LDQRGLRCRFSGVEKTLDASLQIEETVGKAGGVAALIAVAWFDASVHS
jgi:hypothetical protein